MQNKIKNKLAQTLPQLIRDLDRKYSLNNLAPALFKRIKEFASRKGKRLRPALFVIGYLGFSRKAAPNLYKSALSMELLHDFFLVHDDIIDKADLRRDRPTMHKILGQDQAIIAGDLLYALALDAFLSIQVTPERKEKALRKFIRAAVLTELGESLELSTDKLDIRKVNAEDILKIYLCKTAVYTFAAPLACGAILAGAGSAEVSKLEQYGLYLGRAFQIKDDILGMFNSEKQIGKSVLTDLQEAKKTLLIWYAYKYSSNKDKLLVKNILAKNKVTNSDLFKMRKIIIASGALAYAQGEITQLLKKSKLTINSSAMRPKYKQLLNDYSEQLLN
ncbi:MAG: polyprenyl synthetase family protein [Candidatus Omnitrophica bacterium]|nr:polyprenyl synthetase family protein [Candidatus Omnitrophota bacterium]